MFSSHNLRRVCSAAVVSVALVGATIAMNPAGATHGGPAVVYSGNKLPNSSFEFGVGDVTASPQYTNSQPMLPQGWVFEGAAGLFDHSQNDHHTGRRMAAISIPLGGKPRVCDAGPCVDNPATGPKQAVATHYTVNPAWRTALPVPVSAGASYAFKVWAARSFVTTGAGAFIAVRWLNGSAPSGYQVLATLAPAGEFTSWTLLSGSVTAPAGATQAHILLGHTDDTWVGQVMFDDVCFGSPC